MPEKPLPTEQILDMLTEHPKRIAALTGSLTPVQCRTAPSPDSWSVNDVLAHLRSCADVWGSCIQTIIAQDRPTIKATNPRTWVKSTDYLSQEFQSSLRAFFAQRNGLLAVLARLPRDAWARTATITGAGRPLQRSVLSYAQWLATHERSHVKQIARIVDALRVDTGRLR
ncbi:MAG: DinB family protein [Anaerolineae bacterium]|nr:DinB family protein [Anaerolineae bacterium]